MADVTIGQGSFTSTDVASAGTCDIGATTTLKVRITGTTTITSFGTSANRIRFIYFTAALTLTHHGTSLVLPTGANITTAAGDSAIATSDASGNWLVRHYQRASGLVVASPAALATYLDSRAGVWGDPIATASFSASPNVDFTGLSDYRELLVVGQGITHGGADQNMLLRVSDDAGAVYDSSGYVNTGSTITSAIAVTGSSALSSATAWGFTTHIMDFNNATYKTRALTIQGREGATAGAPGPLQGRFDTARINDALRFTDSGSVNLTAGSFWLYGRKG